NNKPHHASQPAYPPSPAPPRGATAANHPPGLRRRARRLQPAHRAHRRHGNPGSHSGRRHRHPLPQHERLQRGLVAAANPPPGRRQLRAGESPPRLRVSGAAAGEGGRGPVGRVHGVSDGAALCTRGGGQGACPRGAGNGASSDTYYLV
ncbi:uncharacterized protein BO95DRAFT_492725, partial [Aspergillus brunneoviolaceus CBS 621.78]